ncbi:glycosyl hydrolase family 28 protein [Gracilimonas mengyeensis]|uniref:Glycosyl hydrolases family 28 n=1 Tax=Gracilimonas mengyeensis TaxID=1302730 RepID=A0A521FD95_9BACT|nr:glycosyl hydrolase family 28 protein [Gracilimonas mengyeensis]SMO94178.1 Glycosyl hydrolases family 28 [Gracilimonas mengyeensis]
MTSFSHSQPATKVPAIVLSFMLALFAITINTQAQVADKTEDIAPINAPFEMEQLDRSSIPDRTYDIRDFGAVPMSEDEDFKNTGAFHRAIETAAADGGGRILVPKGKWFTGPIHLKSNLNLHLADGAEIVFSEDKQDYLPVVRQRHEGVEAYNYSPMIYAYKVNNVSITGKGVLNAQGDHWWEWFEEHGAPPRASATKVPLSRRDWGKGAGHEGMRPSFVVFWKSEDILIEDITLNDSPMWNLHMIYSKRIIIRGVTINSLQAPNGDGVVLDSSSEVLVEYNHFETGDDAVVLKSGLNEEALEINIPTENVVVRNFEARKVRTGSGGVVFGSETSGGIRNVYVHNALFDGSDRGIRFKTERGRGNVVENIYIHDVIMRNITYQAINFNTFYTGPEATGPSPLLRNISIKDVEIDGVPIAIELVGLPEKWIENITLENITVKNSEQGARITRVKNMTMKNVEIHSEQRAMIVEDAYELFLDSVTLEDQVDEKPLLFTGRHTGAIFTDDFPLDQMEFSDGLTEEIVMEAPAEQAW